MERREEGRGWTAGQGMGDREAEESRERQGSGEEGRAGESRASSGGVERREERGKGEEGGEREARGGRREKVRGVRRGERSEKREGKGGVDSSCTRLRLVHLLHPQLCQQEESRQTSVFFVRLLCEEVSPARLSLSAGAARTSDELLLSRAAHVKRSGGATGPRICDAFGR